MANDESPKDPTKSTHESQELTEPDLSGEIKAISIAFSYLIKGLAKDHGLPAKKTFQEVLWTLVDDARNFDSTLPPSVAESGSSQLIQVHQTPTWYTPTSPFPLLDTSQKVTPRIDFLGPEDIKSDPSTPDMRLITPTMDITVLDILVDQTVPDNMRYGDNHDNINPFPGDDDTVLVQGAMPVTMTRSDYESLRISSGFQHTPPDDEYIIFTVSPTPPPPAITKKSAPQRDSDNDITMGTAIRTYGEE